MDITAADLFGVIGEQAVEIRILREQVAKLEAEQEKPVVRPPIKK